MAHAFQDEPYGPVEEAFQSRLVAPDTWLVTGAGCESYLVVGAKRAMMVDTGMSRRDLRAYVARLTDLPVSVVNTHGHFDHTGGNGWFDEVFLHPKAVALAKQAFGNPSDFPLDYAVTTVAEGHVFDLGGRTLEVLEIPAHAPSSIALLDRRERLLFPGDEVESGQVLLMLNPEATDTVARHRGNMRRLLGLLPAFDRLCPSHNGSPILAGHYLQAFLENDERVISGIEGSTRLASPSFPYGGKGRFPMEENPHWRRSEWKGTSIVYDKRQFGR